MGLAGDTQDILSAKDIGVIACARCTRAWPVGTTTCGRCGASIKPNNRKSLQRVWALWLAGLMCYVPANMYPMLQTRTLLKVQQDTIVGGAVELIHHDALGIAIVILLASVVIPLGKFIAIAFLAISVKKRSSMSNHQRQLLFEIVEAIGRWSMVDIFVVAIMSSLVQLDTLAAVNPGIASLFFALSVIFTMLSAQAFDTKMIWDTSHERQGTTEHD
jgi:paraquat-inducible protein A